MNVFEGNLLCGKRSDLNFLEATRPDWMGACPEGYQPCSNYTSADNTYCYDSKTDLRESVCPITGFEFIEGNSTFQLPTYLKWNENITLAFSRDVDSMPATKLKVGLSPCADPQVQIQHMAYGTELQRQNVCPVEPNSGLAKDPNQKMAGSAWATSEYAIEKENWIFDRLVKQPSANVYIN